MRTAVVTTPGEPEAITFVETATPEPGPGQVLLRVAGAGVNPVDLATRTGAFHAAGVVPAGSPVGLGWDVSGTVLAAGPGVDVPVGARVAAMVPGFDEGTYADELVLAADLVAEVPADLDLAAAASVPLNALTADQAVALLPAVPAGERRRLLVTGAAGAVGGHALTLAAERGWEVTGLARPGDEDFVRSRGAGFTAEPTTGWDAVLDAADLGADGLALVRDGGEYVGMLPAFPVEPARGVRVSTVSVVPDAARLAELLRRTAAGELSLRVAETLPLAQAADAHRLVAKGGLRGRVVLVP